MERARAQSGSHQENQAWVSRDREGQTKTEHHPQHPYAGDPARTDPISQQAEERLRQCAAQTVKCANYAYREVAQSKGNALNGKQQGALAVEEINGKVCKPCGKE
jgi:hypothetical protein